MDANDVYEKNSVLKEFVKTLEPDIADKDLQGFINDFLGVKEEHLEITPAVAENVPVKEDVSVVNQQNEVLIKLLKDAVFQFLEMKYQEEKANKKPIQESILAEVEVEDESDSFQLLEELGTMGISKIPTETIHVAEQNSRSTSKNRMVHSKYFVPLTLIGMFSIAAFLIVFLNNKSKDKYLNKGNEPRMNPTMVPISKDPILANSEGLERNAEFSSSNIILSSVRVPFSDRILGNEISSNVSFENQKSSEALGFINETDKNAKEGRFSPRKRKANLQVKRGGKRNAYKGKKTTQHEHVYFAEQD